MIRPLRQRHRHMVIVLGFFLPVAFAVGIVVRKPAPIVKSLPPEITPAITPFESQAWQRPDLFTKSPVTVSLIWSHSGTGRSAIEFSAAKDFLKPDLIVYWVAGSQTINGTLPDKAILLGSFGSTPLSLAEEVAGSAGQLVLFSLADNEIVEVSKAIRFNDSTK